MERKVRKIIPLIGILSLVFLAGCSDNSDENKESNATSNKSTAFKGASTESNNIHEGVWGFCNDKKAPITTDVESCQLIDGSIWHMAEGELTALDVSNTESEGCTTDCFKLDNESLSTSVAARGYYEFNDNSYSFTITESSDEKRFPVCTVSWDITEKLADDLVKWKFRNVDCELPSINYSAWARKYVGQVK